MYLLLSWTYTWPGNVRLFEMLLGWYRILIKKMNGERGTISLRASWVMCSLWQAADQRLALGNEVASDL